MVKKWEMLLLPIVGVSLLLAGCQSVNQGYAAAAPTMTTMTVGSAVPTSVVPTAVPTPLPTATATLTPIPTATPTLFPFPATPVLACAYWRGETRKETLVSQLGETVDYLVHLPPCYESYPEVAFPVLYLLHGWPMDEYHWDNLALDDLADDWMSRGLVGPFIVVMPGAVSDGLYVNSTGGPRSFETVVVEELVPLVDSLYRTWRAPAGRAIGGISRGGVWSLEIGLRHPELFGIIGAHSPALSVNHPIPSTDPFQLATGGAPGQRLYLDAGDVDWTQASTLQLRDSLLQAGADVTYQQHQGGHDDALWQSGVGDYLQFYTASWPQQVDGLPRWDVDPESLWLQGTPRP